MAEKTGDWMSTELTDMLGRPFKVGQLVARAYSSGRAVNLKISAVTRIDGEALYLDGSKVAINYPGRLLILEAPFE